ncbi:SGNH/GDSL hydrolase family protein [Peterkaempfera bronchialis]|uniref:SGNH/GDSL hydrolase family protein n=1 Tax=Peterkaempfera bronchialis TaxID=2126346 RepID=UPI003C2F5887
MRTLARSVALLASLLVLAAAPATAATPKAATPKAAAPKAATRSWTGSWATAPTSTPPTVVTVFEKQTIRQTVHLSSGGGAVRIRLSNEFGDQPLVIGEARVARPAGSDGQRIDPRTDHRVTFGGRTSVTVPAGAPLLSDPVALPVPAGGDLVVSLYLPRRTPGSTLHAFSFQHNFVAAGNATASAAIRPTATMDAWYFLTGVSVASKERRAASVIALGDSITDGANTTPNADHRWPDLLARTFRDHAGLRRLGVLNAGISGNRLLHDPNPPAGSDAESYAAFFGQSALRRFDRDVAAQPDARYLVVLLGVNDLGHPGTTAPASEKVSAADIIEGHRQLIARAHDRGLKVYGATITPFKDDTFGFYNPENEAARQTVNRWIRTSGAYDAVIDFDAALRDPRHPDRLLARYDSGDHLHPNDAGTSAMAAAVPLRLFR